MKNMVYQTGTKVVRPNSCNGPNLSWKRAKPTFWASECYL